MRPIRKSPVEKTHGHKLRALLQALRDLDEVTLKDGTVIQPKELTREQARCLSDASCWDVLRVARPLMRGKQIDRGARGPKAKYKSTPLALSDAIWLNNLGVLDAFADASVNFHNSKSVLFSILRRAPHIGVEIVHMQARPQFEIMQAVLAEIKLHPHTSFLSVLQQLRRDRQLVNFEIDGEPYEAPKAVLKKFEASHG